jgi:hypothetical protein
LSTALVPVRTPGEWAEMVRADLARSVEGFVFRPLLASVEVGADMEVLIFRAGKTDDGWQRTTRAWFMEWLRDWSANAEVAS